MKFKHTDHVVIYDLAVNFREEVFTGKLPDIPCGANCFIIGHHVTEQRSIRELAARLAAGGYVYYHIFGEHCIYWKNAIEEEALSKRRPQIIYSQVDLRSMKEALIACCLAEERPPCVLVSDDFGFTWALKEDVENAMSGKAVIPPRTVEDGWEFVYNGKDCIASLIEGGKIMLGALGREQTFDSVYEAYAVPLFDGKNFWQVRYELYCNAGSTGTSNKPLTSVRIHDIVPN